MLGRYLVGLLKSGLSNRRVGARGLRLQVPTALPPQGNGPMNQNEPIENAIRQIDRYFTEASQPRSDGQPLSRSLRLQALGQQKVGSFTPLLDFQNEQSVQEIPTPLLPNEF
jgi:hypothetical protein